jgi:hypothetical protein
MHPFAARLAVLCLLTPIAAQTVSPLGEGYATKKGNSVMQYPFSKGGGQHRWQQVHGELQGVPTTINSISFRQGGSNSTTALARTVTCELYMGPSSYAALSSTFATNWIGAPRLVMASRTINVPAFTSPPAGGYPAPFTVTLPLDAPYVHDGANGLAWELRVSGLSFDDWTYFDYHAWSPDTRSVQRRIGTGCLASTTNPPTLPRHYMDSWLRANSDANEYRFQWRSWYGTQSQPTTILLAVRETDLPLPGLLCTSLYVDGLFGSISGVAPSSGHWTNTPTFVAPYDPSWAGFKVYSQTVALDPNQAGGSLQVCLSRGEENILPALGPIAPPVSSVHALGSTTAASGTLQRGSVLITEFR